MRVIEAPESNGEGAPSDLNSPKQIGAYATESDVWACFRILLGREPSPDEFEQHRYQVGQSLVDVVTTFATSEEFTNRRHLYFASQRLEDAGSFHDLATKDDIFACFRLLLGRWPGRREYEEHCSWAGTALSEVVSHFINSPEFSDRGIVGLRRFRAEICELNGFRMYIAPDDPVIGRQLIESGEYEPEVSSVFCSMLRAGMRVLDIGANIGYYSMLAASRVGPTGRVWAIEPSPRNVAFLLASRDLNRFRNLQVVQAAASDRWDILEYFSASSNGITRSVGEGSPEIYGETVQAIPATALFGPDDTVDVVKIDVEGAEGLALRGLERILRKCKPSIFTEFSPGSLPARSGMSGDAYVRYLHALGYRLTVLSRTGPIDCGRDASRVMEIFANSDSLHIDLLATQFRGRFLWHQIRDSILQRIGTSTPDAT